MYLWNIIPKFKPVTDDMESTMTASCEIVREPLKKEQNISVLDTWCQLSWYVDTWQQLSLEAPILKLQKCPKVLKSYCLRFSVTDHYLYSPFPRQKPTRREFYEVKLVGNWNVFWSFSNWQSVISNWLIGNRYLILGNWKKGNRQLVIWQNQVC